MDTLELFADLDLGRPGEGSSRTRPIGRRGTGRRRRHPVPRKPSTIAGQLLELRRLVEQQHDELMVELRALRQVRRSEHESLPAVLRRVTEIERHLRLVETPAMPRVSRRRPLGAM